jgi:hypothetical protein
MKRIFQFIPVWVVFALLVASCEKSKEDPPPSSSIPLIRTMQVQNPGTIYNYSYFYDDNNRLTSMGLEASIISSLYQVSSVYKYSDHSVTVKTSDPQVDTLIQTEVYTLNDAGQAIQRDLMIRGVTVTRSWYEYDGNGFLVRDSTTTPNLLYSKRVTTYTLVGNNISLRTIAMEATTGNTTEVTQYWYNGLINTTGYLNQGIRFLGKQNANLADSSRTTPGPIAGPNHYVYTYDLDEKGRIGKIDNHNGMITLYTYY